MDTSNSINGMLTPAEMRNISRVIAETASDAIITINADSVILFVNRATEKIFGYSHDELIGESLTMLMPEYLRHLHRNGLRRYIETNERHMQWEAVQLPGLRKDGTEVPLEVSFGEFIENATDIITILDRDGTRRYVSPSIQRALGYNPQELIGKNPFDLVHPDDLPELRKLFASGLTQSGYTITKEFRIRHKDGSWKTHEATAHNLLDDAAVGGIVINSRDITARKRLERRLKVQYEAARILAEADSLSDAAPKLLQAICESLNWDLGQIWIVDREANNLLWLASWQVESLGADDFINASRARLFARGSGLPGRIWTDGLSHWIHDVSQDANFPRGIL